MKIMIICFALSSIICGQNLKLFTLCEGNFGSANSSLWSSSLNGGNMHDIIHWDENSNPLGDIGQSMSIHETKLYLVMNNSHTIEVMNLAGGAYYESTLQLPNSSPRYITFNEDKGYISSWNFNAILILNLNNMEIGQIISLTYDETSNKCFGIAIIKLNYLYKFEENTSLECDFEESKINIKFPQYLLPLPRKPSTS